MEQPKSQNIRWHGAEITRQQRESLRGHKGCVIWFTGLSGSGKSTVSRRVEQRLLEQGASTCVLDGDNLRHGLNADLGFTMADRVENMRRVGCVAQLFADAATICITALISPNRADRAAARARLPEGRFVEVWVDTPLEVCESRDPKGLYVKARDGTIAEFTGISSPYEEPLAPEIRLRTAGRSVDACADEVVAWLEQRGLLRGEP